MNTVDDMELSFFARKEHCLSRRNEIYLNILDRGLHCIRDFANDGNFRHCAIESDHLHNIPRYIAEGDEANHLYYLAKEVPFYLEQIDQTHEWLGDQLRQYVAWWRELEALIPIEGSPWEKDWRALKAAGWSFGSSDS